MKKKLLQEQKEKAIIESFAKTFNKIKRLDENEISEESLEEINLKKGLATLGLAGAMMLPSKDSAAQNQMSQQQQQGIEKSIDSAQALTLPEKNRKFGKELIDSYAKNPFTAHMWSQKSPKNEKFYNLIAKLVRYEERGGQIEYSDYEKLGEVAQKSPVAMDFMQR
jgi:hypothetical protein